MSYHLFLDDERYPNQVTWVLLPQAVEWKIVRSHRHFVRFIERHGVPLFVSFDHDLAHEHYKEGFAGSEPKYGEYKEETGYESAKWLKEHCEKLGVPLPAFQVHSMNIVGKQNIRNLLNAPTRRE